MSDIYTQIKQLNSSNEYDNIFPKSRLENNELGNEYLWEKVENREVTEAYTATNYPRSNLVASPAYGADLTVWSSYTYEDGVFAVSGESLTVNISPSSWNIGTEQAKVAEMAGYYYVFENVLYQIPEGCRAVQGSSGNESYWAIDSSQATKKYVSTEVVGYVNSPNPNAYPPAVPDGFTYNLLGQLGQGMTKIETGSYVGTGQTTWVDPTYYNTLTFSFVPRLVFITSSNGSGFGGYYVGGGKNIFGHGYINSHYAYSIQASLTDKTLIWRTNSSSDNEKSQLNVIGQTYHYIAIC